jgi:transposase-like protein
MDIKTEPHCPQCPTKDPRFFTKQGPRYRKKNTEDKNAKVQLYLCTECGYKGRGKMFGLTEEME